MVAAGKAIPDHNGLAHGTRVPRIRTLSAKWVLSTVILTRHMPVLTGFEEMAFCQRFDDGVHIM